MTRTQKNGDWTRSSILYFLEIHNKGATAPELGAYMGMDPRHIVEQLHVLEGKGKVHSEPYDRNSSLWHLKPQPRLTPAAPAGRTQSRANPRSR